jgi:glycosyltransferase involved in cell wall biosynthesis
VNQKKVLFLSSWYPSKNNPNLGNFVQRHAEAANECVEVTALFVTSSSQVSELTIEKEIIHNIETFVAYYPKVKYSNPILAAYKKYKTYLQVSKQAFEKINKQFDWVHLNIAYPAGLFALWLKKNRNIPYVLTEQWTGYLSIKGDFKRLPKLVQMQHRKVFKRARAVFPVSSHLGDTLVDHKLITNYQVLHNVVNHKIFYPAESKPSLFRFIHISTFDDPHKNVSGMFRVFKRLLDHNEKFDIQIVTEGDVENVIQLANDIGVPKNLIKVDSSLDQHGVAEKLREANCLVLFSNYETFSVVLAEAWMCGLPCVYSKCGGLTEIDNPLLGVQVEKRDENELFFKLQKILRKEIRFDPTEIEEYAQSFQKSKIADRLKKLYEATFINLI